jgi:hypothetical protein
MKNSHIQQLRLQQQQITQRNLDTHKRLPHATDANRAWILLNQMEEPIFT